jgi:thimet oligopeptidase
VLDRMIAQRAELARILGYDTWANYITADQMVESAANASAFIDRVVLASAAKAGREFEMLLKRKQQDVPGATVVNPWERAYFAEVIAPPLRPSRTTRHNGPRHSGSR